MNANRGKTFSAACLLLSLGLGACTEQTAQSRGPVTAEDWLRADRELMRQKALTSKAALEVPTAEPPTAAPEPSASEGGRIEPPSVIEAPTMPLLPPPEVELRGSLPPATTPQDTPPPEEEAPARKPGVVPPPPPFIAAPQPAETPRPQTNPPSGSSLIPRSFTKRPIIPPRVRLPDPAKLKGFEPSAMQALLGVPDLLRWESHAQVYQYRGSKCVLDIIFYEDLVGGPFRAEHFTARGPRGQNAEVKACLVDLLPAESWPDTLLN